MTSATVDPHLDDAANAVARRLDGRRVAVAESCTAGRIATALAGVEHGTIFVATLVDAATRATTLHIDAPDPDRICDRAARRALRLLADHLAEAGRS